MNRWNTFLTVITITIVVQTALSQTFPKTFGFTGDQQGNEIQPTRDGGYIIVAGNTQNAVGGADIWLIRLNSSFDTVWTRAIDLGYNEGSSSIKQTQDGGFILCGGISYGGVQVQTLLVKTDSLGRVQWNRQWGGSYEDASVNVQLTLDHGYISTGFTRTPAHPAMFYIWKTDSMGNEQWLKRYGSVGYEENQGAYVCQTSDGNYIATGYFGSPSNRVALIKLNSVGDTLWIRNFGLGLLGNWANGICVKETADHGYILSGSTHTGSGNGFLIKTDSLGNQQWIRSYGGTADEFITGIRQLQDGNYLVVGQTTSYGYGGSDIWLLKINSVGDTIWTRTYGGSGNESTGERDLSVTSDSCYLIVGTTASWGAGGNDALLLKVDGNGNIVNRSISIFRPIGGESFRIGTTDTIRWSSFGISGNVNIELNRNYPSASWETLFANTTNDGQEMWNVTGPVSPTARLRILSVNYPTIADTSDANFRIHSSSNSPQYSLSFNGTNSYSEISTTILPTGGSSRSIELWVKTDQTSHNGYGFNPIVSYGIQSAGQAMMIGIDYGNLVLSWTGYDYRPGFFLADGRWHFVCATYQSGISYLYVDGALIGSVSRTINTVSSPLRLGADVALYQTNFNGLIDEVRIWNTLRSISDIQNDMYANLTGVETGLLGSWRLNEGAGTTIYNDVQNGALGVTYNTTWSSNFPSKLTLTRPNGGESFRIGTQDTIRWSSFGISGNVNIELNRNYPSASWETLFASTPNDGQEMWTVAGPVSSTTRLRILSVNYPTIADTSNANFRIHSMGSVNTSSLSFNGTNNSVEIVNPNLPIGNSPRTVEFWMKSNQLNAATILLWGTGGNSQLFGINVGGGLNGFGAGTIVFWGFFNDYGSPLFIADSAWHHVAVTYDGVSLRIIVDNVADTPTVRALNTGASSLVIGADAPGNTGYRGKISELRIWNYARTLPQIQSAMYSSLTGTETGLVGLWRLNEGSGTTAFNDVPGSANGTINGAAWSTDVPTPPSFHLTRPNGGETFVLGVPDTIRWSSVGLSGNVTIKLNRSYPNGAWTTLNTTTPVSQGYLVWTPTAPPTSSSRIAIIPQGDSTKADTSDANFTSQNKLIVLSHEYGGEVIPLGVSDTIRWTSNYATNISISISRNGMTYDSLSPIVENLNVTAGNGSFIWTPLGTGSTVARIYIIDNTYFNEYWSTNSFALVSPILSVRGSPVSFAGTKPHQTDSLLISIKQLQGQSFTYLTVTGSNSGIFTRRIVDTDSNTLAGDSLKIWVKFTPDSILTYRDTLRLTIQTPYQPLTIPLTGLGLGTYIYPHATTLIFPNQIEPTRRDSLSLILNVQGNRTLANGTWITIPSGLPFSSPVLSNVPFGQNDTVKVYFNPSAQGTYSGIIGLVSNAVNADTIKITVSGTSHYVPAAPGHLVVTTLGENANLTWNVVDTSLGGVPLSVQRYLVYFRSQTTYPWEFLAGTIGATATSHTHSLVVTHSPSMYYQVTAWLGTGSTDSFDRIIRSIPVGTPKEEVERQLSIIDGMQSEANEIELK